MEYRTTSCPRNCYSGCSMKVGIEDGRIRKIEPIESNLATSQGVCLKGLSHVERQHSQDRILHPMRKNKQSGSFEPISWEVAYTEIVDRLRRYKSEFGAQSVFFYSASGTKGILKYVSQEFWEMYGGCTTTYGDLCWPAGLEATRLMLGDNKHNAPADLANARLIVMWGKNAAETNIHQMVFVDQALAAGAKLVVIDPRKTQTAQRAHLVIQPRPGTDGLIALAVAKILIEEGQVDETFIERHVHGFVEFKNWVASTSLADAAERSGVPLEQIRQLADWLGTIRPATISCGYGMQRYSNGGQTIRAILSLVALTGNIGRPGAGWAFANLQSHIFGPVDSSPSARSRGPLKPPLKPPLSFYPPEVPDGKVRVGISKAKLGPDMLSMDDPPLKMAWVERGNPIGQNPETNTVLKAFRNLDFCVVVEQFMTDTAREADIVLPAKTMFEQTDVTNAYWHSYIQIKQKVVDPPGEVKPETEIYHELGKRLGFSDEELLKIPVGDAQIDAHLEQRLGPLGLSLEQLRQGPVLTPGSEEIAFADMKFETPSGKIELLSEEAKRRWQLDVLPVYVESEESTFEAVDGGTDSKKYPLYMLSPNTKNRIHSQFNNLKMIRALDPHPVVAVAPQDAGARQIVDGETVRVFNDRGELILPVKIDDSLRPGCVVITNGWWLSEGGCVNVLSKSRETDMGFGTAFHCNLVQVEKRGGE